jgi:aldehyde dehydrogenase (NAD+)
MRELLERLGITEVNSGAWTGAPRPTTGRLVQSFNPATGEPIAGVRLADLDDYEACIDAMDRVTPRWKMLPAPKRGEIVRQIGEALRAHKDDLGALIALEVGKIRQEGLGEVQESIDIADFAVGLSRQLYGLTTHSERPLHRMYEQWHPMGHVAIISAFNFPNAVWAWNAMLAAVCGDTSIWKPSLKAPLTAIATHKIVDEVMERHGFGGVFTLIIGDDVDIGEKMIHDGRIPVVSATGSTRMGKHVGQAVAARLGRVLLELGGNNAIIVDPTAPLDLALGGIVFGAVGTAGQRCTSTRRVFLHEDIADAFTDRIVHAYKQVRIGDPLDSNTLMGPLIDEDAVAQFEAAIVTIREQGGEVLTGGSRLDRPGSFVEPTVVKARADMPIVQHETFAPILYVFTYSDLAQAVQWQNDVPQGLSSAIFTDSVRSAESFLSHVGSDCGIANVNIGTSGAEIGGAFGGEKDTGGGREAGSDSWKAYMRRQTCTINWSTELPLAQGIEFNLD